MESRLREYTIGWLCALPIELAAAQLLLDDTDGDLPYDPIDDTQYTLGSIGEHKVVIGCHSAGELGIASAAAIATRMSAKFRNLRFGLMVGIGGGVLGNKDVRLGDVVVSQPSDGHGGVVQYDFGKSLPDDFKHTGYLRAPPPSLLQALSNLQARHLRGINNTSTYLAVVKSNPNFRRPKSESFKPTYDHIKQVKTCENCDTSETVDRKPREYNCVIIHYGTIASGNCVMKNARERDSVSLNFGVVLCFEMEAAGLLNNWPCLIIRGICDYADSHKNEEWQPYAAGAAAAFAKELLVGISPVAVNTAPTVNDRLVG
jgi:nucleoside phosphorylase